MYKILILFFVTTNLYAVNFKVRAREHYEIHELHSQHSLEVYSGLTNTINLWWEKPYDYSFGFSFSPIIAGINANKSDNSYGDKITQQNIGFEIKYFLHNILKSLYIRPGFGYSRLETNKGESKNFFGQYGYLGLGMEIPMDSYGLALEMAYRYADYANDLIVKTITPSVGFHFYKSF